MLEWHEACSEQKQLKSVHLISRPRFRAAHVGVLILFSALARSRIAAAEPPRIQWRAPDECGTREDFEAGVSRIVGKPLNELGSAWSKAELSIELDGDTWQLDIVVLLNTGLSRERKVVARTCREAVDAAELIVATSLSEADSAFAPSGVASEALATPTTPLAPEARPAPEKPKPAPPAVPTSHREPRASRPARPVLGARLGVDTRLLPAATQMASVALGLAREPAKLELVLSATAPQSRAAGGGSASADLLSSGLLGCYGGSRSRLGAWACAGAELGRFTARGEGGLANHRTQSVLWSAGLVQGELFWALGRTVRLGVGVQGVLAFRPIELVLRPDSSLVYRTPELDVRPWLGVEFGF
jgi:hypothetical protein